MSFSVTEFASPDAIARLKHSNMIPAAADGVREEYDVPRWRALHARYEARLNPLIPGASG